MGKQTSQVSGEVDQSAGMLDDDAKDKGYTLLCVSEPRSDCKIKVIEEVQSCIQDIATPCSQVVPLLLLPLVHCQTRWTLQDEILEQVLCSSSNAG